MGKSYSLWDGNKKIGDIYEKETPNDNWAHLANISSMLDRIIGDPLEEITYDNHKRDKEKILAEMSENIQIEYNKKLDELKKIQCNLIDEFKTLINKQDKRFKQWKKIIGTSRWLPIICAILLNSSMIFAFMKTPDIGGVIFLAVTICLSYFIAKWIIRGIAKLYTLIRLDPISKMKDKIQNGDYLEILYRIDTLVYDFSTNKAPSFELWSKFNENKYLELYEYID